MAKSIKKASIAIIAFAMMFVYSAIPVKAAMLYSASLTLDNPIAGGSSAYKFTMKTKTGGRSIKGISMKFLKTASPTSGNPTSIDMGTGDPTDLIGLTGAWTTDDTDLGSDIVYIAKAAGDALNADSDISWTLSGTNPTVGAAQCAPRNDAVVNDSVANSSGTCYVRVVTWDSELIATMQDEATNAANIIDYTTIGFTVTKQTTMKATVDASMSFTVVGVTNGVDVNDAGTTTTTSEPSTYNTLDFKNLTVGTPKTMAHKLYVKTNAQNGYNIKVKGTTDAADANGILKGQYAGNNIDGYGQDDGPVDWTASGPSAWHSPDSTTANVNSGYLGIHSNDTDTIFNGAEATNWAPMENDIYNTIMTSAGPDLGAEVNARIITYAIEVNVYQPADQYTGTFVYQATPVY